MVFTRGQPREKSSLKRYYRYVTQTTPTFSNTVTMDEPGPSGDGNGNCRSEPSVVFCPPHLMRPQWGSYGHKVGAGLSNAGNTCYLNAVLQCLTHTPPLAIYCISDEHRKTCKQQKFCLMCEFAKHIKNALQNGHSAINPSWVGKNRTGKVLQRLMECLKCSSQFNHHESYMALSLDVKDVRCLEDALAEFVKSETLELDNAYHCDKCKQKVSAEKRYSIHRASNVLAIHLKRFNYDVKASKIEKHIRFSDVLNIRKYMSPTAATHDMEEPVSYRLYGVIVHAGSSSSQGHYYCYVKSPSNTWYHMNDSSVHAVRPQEVFQAEAYVLFYLRDSQKLQNHQKNANFSPAGKRCENVKFNGTSNRHRKPGPANGPFNGAAGRYPAYYSPVNGAARGYNAYGGPANGAAGNHATYGCAANGTGSAVNGVGGTFSANASTVGGMYSANANGASGMYSANANGASGMYSANANGASGMYSANANGANGMYSANANGASGMYSTNTNRVGGMYSSNGGSVNGVGGMYSSNGGSVNGVGGMHSSNGGSVNGASGMYCANTNGVGGMYSNGGSVNRAAGQYSGHGGPAYGSSSQYTAHGGLVNGTGDSYTNHGRVNGPSPSHAGQYTPVNGLYRRHAPGESRVRDSGDFSASGSGQRPSPHVPQTAPCSSSGPTALPQKRKRISFDFNQKAFQPIDNEAPPAKQRRDSEDNHPHIVMVIKNGTVKTLEKSPDGRESVVESSCIDRGSAGLVPYDLDSDSEDGSSKNHDWESSEKGLGGGKFQQPEQEDHNDQSVLRNTRVPDTHTSNMCNGGYSNDEENGVDNTRSGEFDSSGSRGVMSSSEAVQGGVTSGSQDKISATVNSSSQDPMQRDTESCLGKEGHLDTQAASFQTTADKTDLSGHASNAPCAQNSFSHDSDTTNNDNGHKDRGNRQQDSSEYDDRGKRHSDGRYSDYDYQPSSGERTKYERLKESVNEERSAGEDHSQEENGRHYGRDESWSHSNQKYGAGERSRNGTGWNSHESRDWKKGSKTWKRTEDPSWTNQRYRTGSSSSNGSSNRWRKHHDSYGQKNYGGSSGPSSSGGHHSHHSDHSSFPRSSSSHYYRDHHSRSSYNDSHYHGPHQNHSYQRRY
ncbi:hypothetical protein ACOMHN_012955 [Nucella lapillus]